MTAYTRAMHRSEAIYSAAINGTVVKNCDKENEGAFHNTELKSAATCASQLADMSEISDICQSISTEMWYSIVSQFQRSTYFVLRMGDQPCWEANTLKRLTGLTTGMLFFTTPCQKMLM